MRFVLALFVGSAVRGNKKGHSNPLSGEKGPRIGPRSF
jgi:hypothetical protein